jgi:hypothetical protein
MSERRPFGLLAEFETSDALLRAASRVRDAGYTRWDCHSPFPVHGLDRAMGLGRTRLPMAVAAGAATGMATAILMQTWMNAVDYPFVVSGKPLFSLPAQIPIAFELTVLFGAISGVVAMFALNGLPRFHHPVFGSRAFRRATTDRFFITVEAADRRFDAVETERLLVSVGSVRIERLEA